jgi:hypothetical protein
MRRLAPLLLATAVLAACGGGDDKKDAERTVRDFVSATRKRDANKLCDQILSKQFIEQVTGATGDRAHDACKQQLKQLRTVNVSLVRVEATKVDGDKATVTAILKVQDQDRPQRFQLEKEDGDWRLAGGATQ